MQKGRIASIRRRACQSIGWLVCGPVVRQESEPPPRIKSGVTRARARPLHPSVFGPRLWDASAGLRKSRLFCGCPHLRRRVANFSVRVLSIFPNQAGFRIVFPVFSTLRCNWAQPHDGRICPCRTGQPCGLYLPLALRGWGAVLGWEAYIASDWQSAHTEVNSRAANE